MSLEFASYKVKGLLAKNKRRQRELAKYLKCDEATLSKELNEGIRMTANKLIKIAEFFKVPMTDLLEETAPKKK